MVAHRNTYADHGIQVDGLVAVVMNLLDSLCLSDTVWDIQG
jgi:hypothetical protein